MDKELVRRFLRNECSRSEAIALLEQLESLNGRQSFDADFEDFMRNEGESANQDCAHLYTQLMERIRMEQLIESIDHDESDSTHLSHFQVSEHGHKRIQPRWAYKIAATVALLLAGWLVWQWGIAPLPDEAVALNDEWVIKQTTRGQRLTTMLPDGSKVILNYNTTLKYQKDNDLGVRQVHLQGEAFFDVAHNAALPFVVEAAGMNVKVLGTTFSVAARPGSSPGSVALTSGKIALTTGNPYGQVPLEMQPGESAIFDQTTGRIEKLPFIPDRLLAWKEGVIEFDKAGYSEVCRELENWFDVDITTQGKHPDWSFTAKFENENLENILNGISASQGNIKYTLSGKKVFIRTNTQPM